MTPVRLRWSYVDNLSGEASVHSLTLDDWREAAVAISQLHLYDNTMLTGVWTDDLEGFRSYAAHLRPYGVLWSHELDLAE